MPSPNPSTDTPKASLFDRFSRKVTTVTGRPAAFITSFLLIIVWAVSGPFFGFSENWQLVINTGTTIITFLMVFIIQQSQNRDTAALHMKLNELIAASEHASNRLVSSEDLTEKELLTLKKYYVRLSQLAKEDAELFTTHSIDEAKERHQEKRTTKPRHSKDQTRP